MKKEIEDKLVSEYKKIFIKTFEAGGGHGFRYDHGLRTMKYCKKFLEMPYFKNKKINKDAVIIASLFADVGKINAVNKKGEIIYGSKGDINHAEIGAKIIGKYIGQYIKDKDLVDFVARIIGEQHSKEKTSIEAKIVKDADYLDNYGFIKIWRSITYSNYERKGIDSLRDFWIEKGSLENAKKRLDNFNFSVIKKIARKRYAKLEYLILEIDKENNGKDIDIV